MIEKMIEETKKFLPLKIEGVNWDGTSLNAYGDNWGFFTLSSWRISTLKNVLFGCYDDEKIVQIDNIKGLLITDIQHQDKILKIDPVFILSNGWRLEIFSTDVFEPWVFSIRNFCTYVSTPNQPKAFTDGDLSEVE